MSYLFCDFEDMDEDRIEKEYDDLNKRKKKQGEKNNKKTSG